MTQKAARQFSPELRERAARMVQDREREGGTQWECVGSGDLAARSAAISAKVGCSRDLIRALDCQPAGTTARGNRVDRPMSALRYEFVLADPG